MEKQIAVCALIIDSEYQILSVSRKDDISDYGLIGGKLRQGETLLEGLYREVWEETGLEIVEHTLLYEQDDKENKVYTFMCKCRGKLYSEEKGILRWLNEDDVAILTRGSFGEYNCNLFNFILDNPDLYYYDKYVSEEIN